MSKKILEKPSNTKLTKIPDFAAVLLHSYQERLLADESLRDIDVLTLALYLWENEHQKSGAFYEELKALFIQFGRKERPNFGVTIHEAKKKRLIEQDQATKRIHFKIKGLKSIESIIGLNGNAPVRLIKAGQTFSAIKQFEEFLSNEVNQSSVLLCDSHISSATLFPFSQLKRDTTLRILSSNLYDQDKFTAYQAKITKENQLSIDVRKTNKLHDRYIVAGEKAWSIGTSIKDLGNKDTLIIELSRVSSSLKDLFEDRWNEASNF